MPLFDEDTRTPPEDSASRDPRDVKTGPLVVPRLPPDAPPDALTQLEEAYRKSRVLAPIEFEEEEPSTPLPEAWAVTT